MFQHQRPEGGKKNVDGEKNFFLENMIKNHHFALCPMSVSFLDQKWRKQFEVSKNPHLSALESGFDPDVSNFYSIFEKTRKLGIVKITNCGSKSQISNGSKISRAIVCWTLVDYLRPQQKISWKMLLVASPPWIY